VAAHFFSRLAPRYDLRARLAEIAAPTHVIVGAHDWVCPPAAGRAIADAIPGARLAELAHAGHFGFSETPEAFLAAVRAHLARIAGGERARVGRAAA
jgi:proline iminopeptidase